MSVPGQTNAPDFHLDRQIYNMTSCFQCFAPVPDRVFGEQRLRLAYPDETILAPAGIWGFKCQFLFLFSLVYAEHTVDKLRTT